MLSQSYLIAAIGVAISGFAVGWQVASWKVTAELEHRHGQHVTALRDQVDALKAAAAKQSEATAVLEARAAAATSAREVAERHAQTLAAISASRIERLENAIRDAATAGDVVREYWSQSQ